MADLIPTPVLDPRADAQLAAQAIARASGGLTAERIEQNITVQRELLAMVEAGALAQAVCPELSNANPSSPHTVLLEAFAWLCGLMLYRINQVPSQNLIAFARLFGIELRVATPATTTLRFAVASPPGVSAAIPAGTEVATEDGQIVFATDVELVIPPGTITGDVSATCTAAGAITLAPDTLTNLLQPVAWVTNLNDPDLRSVTNPYAVASGSDQETVPAALERARNSQRRAERLVSSQDIEDAILQDVLAGNGVARAFSFIKDGDYSTYLPGHTTVVAMTLAGDPLSDEVKARIRGTLQQAVGNQFIYLKDPSFVSFAVTAGVRLTGLVTQSATLAAIGKNLQNFYAPTSSNFGRSVYVTDIITIIQETQGVDRIVRQQDGSLLAAPVADVSVAPYELPRLGTVTLNVVP
jgi:hypothetical protein